MKRLMLVCLTILCLVPLCGLADETATYDVSMAMANVSGVYDHVAFALPGAPTVVADADAPNMFTGSRQLAGYCVEDGVEFQLRSADIAPWIEDIREDVMAEIPDATEDIVRVNALFAYAMMMPGQMGAELQSAAPHGFTDRDWLWLEGTFTYPDTPGAVYHLKAMLTGTHATTLVIGPCDHAQKVLDALRFVDDEELAEIRAELEAETTVDFFGLSVTFPREPTVAETDSFTIAGAFTADWAKVQAEWFPVTLAIDAPEEEQLETMLAVGQKAIKPYDTDQINDPVLSHPAPDMLQLDFWATDATIFDELGPKILVRVYAGARGVWYVTADDGDSGRRFLEAMHLTDPESVEAVAGEPAGSALPAEAAVEPAATLPELKANLAILAPDLNLAWCTPTCSGGEWVTVGFPVDALIGGVRVSLASSSEEAAIREVRVVAYDGLDAEGLRLASLCALAMSGEPVSVAKPTAEEVVTEAGTLRIAAQHLSPEGSALVYDRVVLTPETVPPLLEEITFPEGESLYEMKNGPTMAEIDVRLARLREAFLPDDYTLMDIGSYTASDDPRHAYVIHDAILVMLYLDGEGEDARVNLIAVMALDGDAPGVLATTMLFYAAVCDLSDLDCMARSYLLIETPFWDQLADLWPLMAQGDACAFLMEDGESEEDWMPMGFVGGTPAAER